MTTDGGLKEYGEGEYHNPTEKIMNIGGRAGSERPKISLQSHQ